MAILGGGRYPGARKWAAIAIAETRYRKAVKPLMFTVAQDPDPEVREEAANELAAIGDPVAIPALERAGYFAPGYPGLRNTAAEKQRRAAVAASKAIDK